MMKARTATLAGMSMLAVVAAGSLLLAGAGPLCPRPPKKPSSSTSATSGSVTVAARNARLRSRSAIPCRGTSRPRRCFRTP